LHRLVIWRRFKSDRRGASAVEFGLIAIPFLGLLLAIFETGLMFLNSEGLEAAVQDAARNIMTGQAQAANVSTASQFVSTYMCPSTGQRILPSFIDCTKLIVDVRTASNFSSADVTKSFYQTPSSQQFCPGGPGVVTIVRVLYPMPVFLPLLGGTIKSFAPITAGIVNDVPGNAGYKHLLLGTAVFQNEPYQGSTYTPPAGC
jgi:Flp pilus assembly protein TadG